MTGVKGKPVPAMPPELEGKAAELWKELAPHAPWLNEGSAKVFADFCYSLAELEEQRAKLKTEGYVVPGIRSDVKNPRMQAVRELRTAVQRYAAEFGFTAASAYRLSGHVDDGDEADGLMDDGWENKKPPKRKKREMVN